MKSITISLRAALCAVAIIAMQVVPAWAQHYTRTDLTTDMAAVSPTAAHIDPSLQNAWGLTRSSTSPWWISDNNTGFSTFYDSTGAKIGQITIPTPPGDTNPATPTGTVWNFDSTAFMVAPGKAAIFLFSAEDGTISGWNPGVNPAEAVIAVNNNGKAVYKGLAIGSTMGGTRLFATNFLTGRVDVFDANFNRVSGTGRSDNDDDHGAFHNPFSETYAPFGIQNVGGNIVVTYAKRSPGSTDEQHGSGLGHVAIFDMNGRLISRLQDGPWFNAPWGIALAPSDFGSFSHRLLIGNFGDGTIHAFNFASGSFEGTVLTANTTQPLTIEGLWAIEFGGNATRNGSATTLFFTAGPNDEHDGIYGMLTPISAEQRGSDE